MTEFKEVTHFNEIIELAKQQAGESSNYKLNFNLPVKIDTTHLNEPHFPDIIDIAKDYHQKVKPDRLYVSHGEYYNGPEGIKYIIAELNNKSDGNRAVLSLLNQSDIVGSEDNPIPSFMVMQFSLENQKDLFVTTYFRALEVSNFLRINLEEFRLILNQILKEIMGLEHVYLTIFSFRAYINDRLNPFIRPAIEFMSDAELLKLMEKSPIELSSLLQQMDVDSSYLENNALKTIHKVLGNPRLNVDVLPIFKTKHFLECLETCIGHSEELIVLRKRTSHNELITKLNKKYLESLRKLIKEIEHNQ